MEEMERMEELEGFGLGIPRPKHDGERILRRHMYLTARFTETVGVKDVTPFTKRVLNYNCGSSPESAFRVYCPECKKMRTLIIYPALSEVEFKASCPHVVTNAVALATKDSTLVYVGRYRIIPAGVARFMGIKVLG